MRISIKKVQHIAVRSTFEADNYRKIHLLFW